MGRAAAASVAVAAAVAAAAAAAAAVSEQQRPLEGLAFSLDSELLEVVLLSWLYLKV